MRVRLKGVCKIRSKGVDYFYAWRGGPRLKGEPGSAEFIESYMAAHAARREVPKDRFHSIIIAYKMSPDFLTLAPRTKVDYRKHIAKIEVAFGDMPLAALDDVRVTKDLIEWRDSMGGSPRQADYSWMVLCRLLSWARGRGITAYRPPERIGRLYTSDRADKIWSEQDVARFLAVAPESLQRAIVLALETGQRQGDLLRLPWSAYQTTYDGAWIRLKQGKTGRAVAIPVTTTLRRVLDATPRIGPVILTAPRGAPWASNGFAKAWRKACKAAGIKGLTFHDLRGTAVTRLAEAGCTVPEIAAITGHSLRSVSIILDTYLARTDKLAIAAIRKLELVKG